MREARAPLHAARAGRREGYFLLGRHFQARGEQVGAVRPLEEAIARNPSFSLAHALLGQVLAIAGRADEGVARIEHAVRLDAHSFVAGLACVHSARGAWAESLEAAERAVAQNPRYAFARALAALA